MKRIIFTILTFLIVNITFAQDPDMDNDGVPDSEDVCPNVVGTKANKGCPEEKKVKKTDVKTTNVNPITTKSVTTNTPGINNNKDNGNIEFLSTKAFFGIMDMVCKEQFAKVQKSNTQPNTNDLVQTNLPMSGKNSEFPIFYKNFGNYMYSTYVILSSQIADLEATKNELIQKFNQKTGHCLVLHKFETKYSRNKDTIFIINKPNSYYDTDKILLTMAVYIHNFGNNQYGVVWEIASNNVYEKEQLNLRKAAVENQSVITKIKAKGIKDKSFEKDLNTILEQGKLAFINNRKHPIQYLGVSGEWRFHTNLQLADFDEIQLTGSNRSEGIFSNSIYVTFVGIKYFNNVDQVKKSNLYYDNLIAKLDGNLLFTKKDNNSITTTYTITQTQSLIVTKESDEVKIEIKTFVESLKLENGRSIFGINDKNLENLKIEILLELEKLYNEFKNNKNILLKYVTNINNKTQGNFYVCDATKLAYIPFSETIKLNQTKKDISLGFLSFSIPQVATDIYLEALKKLEQKFKKSGIPAVLEMNSLKVNNIDVISINLSGMITWVGFTKFE